jgi:spermidine synthase
MPIYKNWFLERKIPGKRERGIKHYFLIEKIIFKGKSKFQDILIFKNPIYGRILALNGILQLTEYDEFIYHEMISHSVLFSHENPKKILIIGGGDGGALREVLKHPVEKVHLVEMDKTMIDLTKTHLRFVSQDSFSDKRVKVFIERGEKFLKNTKEKYDIIIVDSLNFGEKNSLALFCQKFYKRAFEILTKEGMLITLGASFLDFNDFVKKIFKNLKKVFPKVFILRFCVPSFHCGEYCFLVGSKKIDLKKVKIERKFKKFKNKSSLKYFSPEIFKSSLILPKIFQL